MATGKRRRWLERYDRTRRVAALALLAGMAAAAGGAAMPATIRYVESAKALGVDFTYRAGGGAELHLPAIVGGGAALFDFDNDGDLDLFLVQGGELDAAGPRGGASGSRLYRNDPVPGADGRARPRFVDVTAATGAGIRLYGMGVAAADFDRDGFVDLFVAGFGDSRLLRNVAGERFEDVTAARGLAIGGWAVSASFFEADPRLPLALYVARYLDYPLAPARRCFAPTTRPDYCGPQALPAASDLLFVAGTDGRYSDLAPTRLAGARPEPALGVVAADLDDDGRIDLLVANDGRPNAFWRGRPDGGFVDGALLAGLALNRSGLAEANMGIALGDADGDLRDDLLITHLTGETNTFYRNLGGGLFEDRSLASALGPPSFPWTGFGAAWVDPDRDGDLDLVTVAGAVRRYEAMGRPADPLGLGQPAQLFANDGRGRFTEISAVAGFAPDDRHASRGLAAGDLDDDGDLDLVVVDLEEPVRIFLDESVPAASAWLGLRLADPSCRRDELGATARLLRHGAPPLQRRAQSDGSYASARDPRLLFGLAGGDRLEAIEVTWPGGARERFPAPAPGRYTRLCRGRGTR